MVYKWYIIYVKISGIDILALAPSTKLMAHCFNWQKLSISPVEARIASNWLWLRCYQLFGSNMAAHLTLERLNSCLQAVVITQTSGIRLLLIFLETNMREQMCNDLSDFLDKAALYENNSQFLLRLTWWQSRWSRNYMTLHTHSSNLTAHWTLTVTGDVSISKWPGKVDKYDQVISSINITTDILSILVNT